MKTLKKQPNLNDNTVATYVCQCVCYCSCGVCACNVAIGNSSAHHAVDTGDYAMHWGSTGLNQQGSR